MEWPEHRIEERPTGEFRPPFCPHPRCVAHRGAKPHFDKLGQYTRKCDDRTIRRWLCKRCGRSCSEQTFSVTYYLKRPELLPQVAAGLVAGSAHRQIARSAKCSHTTVGLQQARLGRHALLLHAYCLEHLATLDEPIVYDDFESFVLSQDHAFGMGTPVGKDSWFVYGLDYAPHRIGRRRAGKRRAVGKEHRRPGSYTRSFRATLDRLLSKVPPGQTLDLTSDSHPAYKSGVSAHRAGGRVRHRVFPNPRRGAPRSAKARRRDRAMFPVDLLHKLLRHSLAHHRRETIAFGRRLNAALERGFLFLIWRNLIKGRSERRPDRTTPGMALRLTDEPWDWSRVLARRLFPMHLRLPERWLAIYRRELVTELLGANTRHTLKNAY